MYVGIKPLCSKLEATNKRYFWRLWQVLSIISFNLCYISKALAVRWRFRLSHVDSFRIYTDIWIHLTLWWNRGRLKLSCSALWHWSFHFVSGVHARTANVVGYWFLGFKPDWISLWCCIVFKSGVPDGLHLLLVCPLFIYALAPEHRHGRRRCLAESFVMILISEGHPDGGTWRHSFIANPKLDWWNFGGGRSRLQ